MAHSAAVFLKNDFKDIMIGPPEKLENGFGVSEAIGEPRSPSTNLINESLAV
jgi:hypothetical protein